MKSILTLLCFLITIQSPLGKTIEVKCPEQDIHLEIEQGSDVHIVCNSPIQVNIDGQSYCNSKTECNIPTSSRSIGTYEGEYYVGSSRYGMYITVAAEMKCEGYSYDSFTFPLNILFNIMPPRCSSPVNISLAKDSSLPQGLNLELNGRISGIATSATDGMDVKLIANGDSASVELTIKIIVKESSSEFGILSQTTPHVMNSMNNKIEFQKLYENVVNGEIGTINNIYKKGDGYCSNKDECKIKIADLEEISSNRYTIWSSNIKFKSLVKGFYLPLDPSIASHCAMIINNNVNEIILGESGESVYTFVKEISEIDNYYYISFIIYDVSIKEQLSVFYSDDGKNFIPIQADYQIYPNPIQYFEYPNNNEIFYKSVSKRINGIVYGGYSTDGWENNLPSYLKINNNGEIIYDGNSEVSFPTNEEKYTIKPKNNKNSYDIYFNYKDLSVENMGNGLIGRYYKANIGCEYKSISESKKLKFKKYDEISSIIHNVESNEIWSGLSYEFENNFYVIWDGYIYIPISGTYEIQMSVNDGGRIEIGNNELLIESCGLSNSLKDFTLEAGLHKLKVEYWKSNNDNKKLFKIEYRCKSCSDDSVLTEITSEFIYYLHPSKLYYEKEIGSYLVGKDLSNKGLSSLSKEELNNYNSFTINPTDYPLSFTKSDIISNLDKSSEWRLININADSIDESVNARLVTSIVMEVKKIDKPEGFSYSESVINKRLGEEIELKASLISGSEGTRYEIESDNLPIGLKFDNTNGNIKGRLLEVMSDREVIIRASNPGGHLDFTLKFTVNGCEANSNFFYIQYTPIDNKLKLKLKYMKAEGIEEIIYESNMNEEVNKEYYQSFCQSSNSIIVDKKYEGHLHGDFIIKGEKEILFHYGYYNGEEYKESLNEVDIKKDNNPSIQYGDLNDYELIIGKPILIIPIKYTSISGIRDNNGTSLPDGLSIDKKTGVISGKCKTIYKDKSYQIKAENGEKESAIVTLSFTIKEKCSKGELYLLSLHSGNNKGEIMSFKLQDVNKVIYEYTGFPNNYDYEWSFCYDKEILIMNYGGSSIWDIESKIILTNVDKNERREYKYVAVVEGGMKSDIISSYKTAIDSLTIWQKSVVYEENWHSTMKMNENWSEVNISDTGTASGTTYYRTSFINISPSTVQYLIGKISSIHGGAFYLNGNFIYKFNLPDDYKPDTPASMLNPTSSFYIPAFLTTANNVNILGFEFHKTSMDIDMAVSFTLQPYSSSETCINQDLKSYRIEGNEITKLIDGDLTTSEIFQSESPVSENNPIEIILKSAAEAHPFLSYSLSTRKNEKMKCNSLIPKRWKVYGAISKDSNNRIELDEEDSVMESGKTYYFTSKIKTTKVFESIIFVISETLERSEDEDSSCGYGVELSELNGRYCLLDQCKSESYPASNIGSFYKYPCPNGDGSDSVIVKCNLNGIWDDEDFSECPKATSIKYPQSSYEFTVGLAIIPIKPIINGAFVSFVFDPLLPNGIKFNPSNGEISGTPIYALENGQTFTIGLITGDSGSGSVEPSTQITIKITSKSCDSEGSIPKSVVGTIYRDYCENNYSGYRTIKCEMKDNEAKWSSWNTDYCVSKIRPTCKIENEYIFNIKDSVNIDFSCSPALSEVRISPSLPLGLKLSNDGKLSGIAETSQNAEYSISLKTVDGGFDNLSFKMRVWDVLSKCYYPFSENKIKFVLNEKIELLSPKCNTEVGSYEISGLPDGMSYDSESGIISGKPNSKTSGIIITKAKNGNSNTTEAIIEYEIVDLSEDVYDNKLIGLYSQSDYISDLPNTFEPFWSLFERSESVSEDVNSFKYEEGYSPENVFSDLNLDSSNQIFQPNIERDYNYFIKWYGFIKFSQSGSYYLKIESEERVWLFIDDMKNAIVSTTSNSVESNVYISKTSIEIEDKYYAIGVMYYHSKDKNFRLKISYSSDNKEYFAIEDSMLYHVAKPLQSLKYPQTHYLFRQSTNAIEEIKPTSDSTIVSASIIPSFTNGLEFDELKGIISGSPSIGSISSDLSKYTITVVSKLNSISVDIYIDVLEDKIENYERGVNVKYYLTSNNKCDRIPSVGSSTIERIELKISHSVDDDWYDLGNNYLTDFLVEFDGSINIENENENSLSLESYDSVIVNIDGVEVIKSLECGENNVKKDKYKLSVGIHKIEVKYWKSSLDSFRKLILKLNNEEIQVYTFLGSYMKYNIRKSEYISGKEIKKIDVLFLNSGTKNQFTSFSIDPPFSYSGISGLLFNSETGEISGTPVVTRSGLSKEFIIRAKDISSKQENMISDSIKITINIVLAPSDLKYDDISGGVGEWISVFPKSINNGNGVRYSVTSETKLPTGLELNGISGEISGSTVSSFIGTIEITATNDAGSTKTNVNIKIEGCNVLRESNIIVRIFINSGSDIRFKFGVNINDPIFSQDDFNLKQLYEFKNCMEFGEKIFSLNGNNINGWYEIFNEDDLLKYEEMEGSINVESKVKTDNSRIPSVSYENTEITQFSSFKFIPTIINGIKKIEIKNLPKEIKLNETNGIITGLANEIIKNLLFEMTVTNSKNIATNGMVQFSFVPVDTNRNTIVKATITTKSNGNDMIIRILKSSDKRKVLEWKNLGDNNVVTKTQSIQQDLYVLELSSSTMSGWSEGSKVTIEMDGTTVVADGYFEGNAIKIIPLSSHSNSLITSYTKWEYKSDNTEPPSDWYKSENTKWDKYSSGNFPKRSYITSYYKTSFYYYDNSVIFLYGDMKVDFDDGIIIYVNGKEIYRKNIIKGDVTKDTKAFYKFSDVITYSIRIHPNLLLNGNNIIGVELHNKDDSEKENKFKLELSATSGESNHITQITPITIDRTSEMRYDVDRSKISYPDQFSNCKDDYVLQSLKNSHDDTKVPDVQNLIRNCNGNKVQNVGQFFTHRLFKDKASTYPYKISYIFKEYVANAFDLIYFHPFSNDPATAPAIFDIYGSTDYNEDDKSQNDNNWELLYSYNNKNVDSSQGKIYNFELSNIKSFEAYQLKVVENKNMAKQWVQFNELQMRLKAQKSCVADDNHKDYPKTNAGDTVEFLCPDPNQLGSIKITCKSDGKWDDANVINTCFNTPSDKIYYSKDNIITFYVDFTSSASPSSPISGTFTKDCELPSGLSFNDENGIIYGKANSIEGEEISVKCNIKVSGEYSSEVTIKVIQIYCASDGEYEKTKAGSKNEKGCGELYNGERYRNCPLELSPTFEDEVNTCDPFPPLLSYEQSEYYLIKNEKVDIKPIIGGLIKEWEIKEESELPEGIEFSNGIFSGLASESKSLTRFIVKAKNEKYENSTQISIQVINGIPKNMTILEENIIYTNVEIIKIKPILDDENNGFLECKSDPELPTGLIINSVNCEIRGKVSDNSLIGEKSYILTGSIKENKISSNSFKIKILKGECIKEEEGKDPIHIEVGKELQEFRCNEEQKGYKSFECLFENPPKFSEEIDKCVYKYPSSFSYNRDKIETTMYNKIELKPLLGGSSEGLTSKTVFRLKSDSVLLPKDLELNENSGIINGTLSEYIENERIITIEVENEIIRETNISFKIDYAYCPAIEGVVEKTKVNSDPIIVKCAEPQSGDRTLKCEKENEWTIDESGCIDPEVGTITYPSKELLFNVGFYDIFTPTIEGFITDIKILDRLPNGLSLNNSDGSIYGSPSTEIKQNINIYTFYKTENKTTPISITVTQLYCEDSEGKWDKTETGKLSEKECPPEASYGQNYRKCPMKRPNPEFEAEVNTCHVAYPESIKYNENNIISIVYNKDVNEKIEVSGTYPVEITFNLGEGTTLPDELKLNESDGTIYGKLTNKLEPGVDSTKLYKICCNGDVSICIDIKFDVGYSNCPKDDDYESTEPGKKAEIDCRNGRPNKESRECNKYGEWEKADTSKCVYPAPELSYEKSNIKVYVNEEIESNKVRVTGEEITKYVISPKDKLNGLIFNESTGIISGKPTLPFDQTFNIYCENEGGKSNEVEIKIKSLYRKPSDIYYGENKDDKSALIFKVKLIQEYKIKQESGGTPSSYSISDVNRLNSYGIKFDTKTGRIYTSLNSDPPKVVENINPFTVTATNEDGEASVEVNIKIIIPNCPEDDDYPETNPGETAKLKCKNGVDAYETRKCTVDGKWEEKYTFDCGYEAPKQCRYNTNNDFIIDPFAIDTSVNRIEMKKPTLDTRVNSITLTSESCKSALESVGLEWDENNGIAIGIATSQKLRISCTAKATNDKGSRTCNTFYISVYYKAPTVMTYNPNSFIFYTNVEISGTEDREIKLDSIVTKDYELARSDQNSLLSSHGISLDGKSGFIEGTPNSQTLEETMIFVKGVNDKGYATGNFTISIIFPNCPKDGDWPITEANKVELLKCVEGYTEKFRKRECLKNGTWGEIDTSDCFDKVVTSLHYNPSSLTFYVGNEIIMNSPTYYGKVVEFEITNLGVLENVGIKWNKSEGILYGSPTGELEKAEYEVRAVNNGGKSDPYILTIIVEKEPARLLVVIPNSYIWSKNSNGTVTTSVPYVIGNPVDYSISSISVITSCGLKFDQWTGQIYGSPNEVLVTQSFILTANNVEGVSPTTTITITIKSGDLLKCEKIDDNWPESTGGEVLYNACSLLNKERSGIISRKCLSSGVWDNIDESQCKQIDKNQPDKDYLHLPFSFIVHGLDIKNIREIEYKILQEKILNAFGAYRNNEEMSVETIIERYKDSRLLSINEEKSEGVIFNSVIRMKDNGNDTDEAISFFKSTFTKSYIDKNILKSESSELLLGSIKSEITFEEVRRYIPDDKEDDSGTNILIIIIPIASVVAVVLICVISVLLWKAKSRTRARSTAGSTDYRTHLPSVSFSESRARGMSNASQASMNSNGGNSGRNRGMSIANQAKHTSKKVRV